jgi:regulator of RNase E activity RraA
MKPKQWTQGTSMRPWMGTATVAPGNCVTANSNGVVFLAAAGAARILPTSKH